MADWDAAQERAPQELMQGGDEGREALEERLAANPEIAYTIIRDVYDAVLALEEREAGTRRTGRRPTPSQVPLSEVWAKILPAAYSNDPFPQALEKLLNGRSQRQFAKKIPCHQTTLSRLLSGSLTPDLLMLERVAEAAGVAPWFFLEWRAIYVGTMVTNVLASNPNLSITAIQRVGRLRR